MANLGQWTGGAVAILPTTTWAAPANMFPTEARNNGYTFSAATSLLTLPASSLSNGYLFVAAFEFEDTSNGRCNPQGRFIQASGTGTFVTCSASGYNRDNSEDRSYVRCWGFVDNPSASSTYQFQWRRDTDAPTGGTIRATIEVIPLYYSDVAIYSSTSTACPGGTTPNLVTGFSGTDGTNITLSSDVITLAGDNKNYFALGGFYWQGIGNSRTQRWGGFAVDGSFDNAAKGCTYARNGANADIGEGFTKLLQTTTTDRTLAMNVYRGDGVAALQGGADVDGNVTGSNANHVMVVLELNDSAEVFYSRDTNQSANLATTGPIDLDVVETLDFNDATSYTRASAAAINVEQDHDLLFGANISCASNNVGTGNRWTAFSELTVNGTEDSNSFAGDYMRNNQGSQDTFGWSANLIGSRAVVTNDDLGVSVTELPGSEGGGGSSGVSPAGWSSFWGINLDTLEGGGPAPTKLIQLGSSTVNSIRLGSSTVNRVYLGSTLVYEA